MNKQQMLNGMSEKEFYDLYPTEEHYEMAYKKKGGFIDSFNSPGMINQKTKKQYGGPTPEKAQAFLKDGSIYGHPLSDRQRTFFSGIAGTDENGNLLDEETGEPIEAIDQEEQEFKHGGNTKRIEVPEGAMLYMLAMGGENTDLVIDNDQSFRTKSAKDISKFIKQVNVLKLGGDQTVCTPTSNVNDIVANKKNIFAQYLQKNTMKAIAEEEAANLMMAHQMVNKYGGSMYAYGGEDYDKPIGPETPLEMAQRLRREALARENALQPQPQELSNKVSTSQVEEPSSYDWSANPFGQKTPENPNQVTPMTMTGTQAPSVVPSTSQTMDEMTPYPAMDSSQGTTQKNSSIPYTQSSTGNVPYGQMAAESIITGMEGITMMLNRREEEEKKKRARERMNADAIFTPVTGSNNRGSYDVNSGAFRPDDMVPQQFKGNTYGQIGYRSGYALGGEHMMDDDRIKELIKQGYKIDYLD